MVAVVSGNGLGLDNSSLRQLGLGLGGQATIGQGMAASYLNAVNGNLVLENTDEGLIFDGLSLNVLRTYNSQGQLSGNQGWQFGFSRSVGGLTGTLDTAGSTITRTDDDGTAVTYTYNTSSGQYVSSDQSGASDTLAWSAASSTWTWADAASSQQETYNATGQLTVLSDTQTGAQYSFSYSGGLLSQIKAGGSDADTLTFGYTSGQLTSLSISEVPPGGSTAVIRQQVSYSYDTQGRLSTVTTLLTSDTDSSPSSYTTTYGYDGTSDRVTSVTQSDGTSVSYSYTENAQGVYQVTGIITGTGAAAQSLTLSYGSGSTTVTNALGQATTYTYNAAGELTQVVAPTVNGSNPTTNYSYDANGNLLTSIDATGATTSYRYDASGNLLSVEDATGHTVSYTYNAADQVLSQTVYTVAAQGVVGQSGYVAPSGAQTTYYVYDASNRLNYVVDPLGNVTEHDYTTASGLTVLSSTKQYLGASYSLTGLSPSAPPNLTTLQAWVASSAVQSTLAQSTRTDYTYDVRGQLAKQTQWDTVNSSGVGVLDAGTTITTTTYDAYGQLLQTATERGGSRTTLETTSYAYDSLGRLISTTDPLGNVTSYLYIDSSNTLAITQANGLTTTQVRNSAGLLLNSTQSASGQTSRVTSYLYNTAGEQVAQIDPAGNVSYTFYDADGQVAGTVNVTGAVTAYAYDADGRMIGTTQYATAVSTAGWVSGGALTASLPASLPVPTTTASDRTSQVILDAAGRTLATIDAEGNVTTTTYDGEGHAISSTAYATALTPSQLTALGNTPTWAALQADLTLSTANRTTYIVYDADGRAAATIDAAGYVTTTTYDDAGRAVKGTAYATVLTTAQLSALGSMPSLTALQADLTTSISDQITRTYYDSEGRAVAQVDADGYLTITAYNETTHTTTTTRYAAALTTAQLTALTGKESVATLVGLLGSNTTNQQSSATDNADNQLVSATAVDGTVTTYTYNSVGQLLTMTVTPVAGQGTARTTATEYDAFGEVIGKLDGVGATNLTAGMTAAQQAAVFTQDGTTTTYNALGQPIQSTDPLGNSTWTYYDADGRVAYTVQGQPSGSTRNAVGNVTVYNYSTFGQVASTRTYASQLTLTSGSSSGTTLNPAGATLVQLATAVAALPVSASDANGLTSYSYTLDGQLASVTNGDNYQTAFTYNAFGNRVQTQQQLSGAGNALSAANSTISTFAFDNRGEQIGETDGVGSAVARSTSSTYDAFGRVTSTTDGNGNVVSYGYDNLGRQISTSQTVQGVLRETQIQYDAFDRILKQTDALGNVTSYQYNLATHTTIVTTPDNLAMTTTKDAFGDTVSITDGAGDVTSYTYDADGRLLTTKDALLNTSTNQYDADGDLLQTTDATGHVVTYSYDASGRVLTQKVDPAGLNLVTTYAYDGEGRELSVTDPTGTVTTYAYDADGNTLTQVQDAGNATHLNLATTYTYDGTGKTLTVTVGAGTSAARTSQYVYDNLERLSQQIVDPGASPHLNLTTSYAYDANNNLTSVTDANGHVTRSLYNEANELTFTLDPTGAVTQTWYDADGRVTQTRGYVTALTSSQVATLGTSPTIAQLAAMVTATIYDSFHQTAYNGEGQPVYELDGVGLHVTQMTYDAAGRLIETTRYATLLSSAPAGTSPTAASIAALVTTSAADETTLTTYDADGHARFTVQTNTVNGQLVGVVSEQRYDAAGRVIASIAYGSTIPLSTSQALTAQVSTSGLSQTLASAPNESTQSVYDNAGRLRYTINNTQHVSETQYDNDGRVLKTLFYPIKITVPATLTVATVGAAVATAGTSGARISTTTYDAAGRVLTTGDALNSTLGVSATYTYDATGLVLTQADRDGNITTFTYDTAGRKLQVQSPAVTVGSYSGTTLQTATQYLYTTYTYDSVGNVESISQGSGPSAGPTTTLSTTSYLYDAVNHQIQTTYSGTPPASTHVVYNALGQAVVDEDANGNYQYKTYVSMDWVNYSVDADGYVTATGYDAFGNIATVTRYATPLNTAAITGWTAGQPLTATQLQQGLVTSSSDRTITTTYNQLNQKTQVQQSQVSYALGFGPVNGTAMAAAAPTTTYTYDAYGNVTSTSTLLQGANGTGANATPAIWATTYTYYDALNRAVMTIIPTGPYTDPHGFVTTTTYDAFGDVISTTQYATSIDTTAVTTASMPTVPATSTYDRTTVYAYDAIGRKQSETDTGAVSYTGGTVGQPNGIAGITTASSVTSYTYDGENRVLTINVNGAVTTTVYDAAGRVISVTAPARQVLVGNWQAILESTPGDDLTSAALYTTVSPVTAYVYDALGNALSTTVSATGDMTEQTFATYNARGNQLTVTDADGNVTTSTYDGNGNVLTQSYTLTNNGASSTVTTTYKYDAENQQTLTTVQRSGQTGYDSYTQVKYDAFGDIVAKGDGVINAYSSTGYEAIYTYDNAGNLISAPDATTGAIHTYAYDLAGQQVTDTSTVTGGGASTATVNYLNLLGRVVQKRTPNTNASSGTSTAVTYLAYDRWGNVTSLTDANGNVTTYAYDSQNQLIQQTEASVSVVSATGGYTTATPTKSWYYNVDGELMGVTDENGNSSWNTYDAAGHLTIAQDATSAKTITAYDGLGNALAQQTPPANTATGPVANITFTTYDALNQITQQGNFLLNNLGTGRTLQAQETYALNSNGDRIQVTDALNNTSYYSYDSQHRVLSSQTPIQHASGWSETFTYDVNGNKTSDTTADGDTQSWLYDYFGRVRSHTDLSGALTTYTYDAHSGLLTSVVSNWTPAGQASPGFIPATMNASTSTVNYAYYADGQIEQQTEYTGTTAIAWDTYQYDADGNATVNNSWTGDGAGQEVLTSTATAYDSHNRITLITETNTLTGAIESREAINYDAAGNRRAVFSQSAYGSGSSAITSSGGAPTVGTVASQTVTPGQPWNWSVASGFTDNLGFGLSYTATQSNGSALPSWMTLNPNGTFSGNPSAAGSWTITVTATDVLGRSVTSTFTVTVPIAAPVFTAPAQNVTEAVGKAFSFTVPGATDPNGLAVNYSAQYYNGSAWVALPSWVTFNASTLTFSGTPPAGTTGNFSLVVWAAGSGTLVLGGNAFTLTVSATSAPPVYNGGVPATVDFYYDSTNSWTPPAGAFTNPSGSALVYSLTPQAGGALPSNISFNSTTGNLSTALLANITHDTDDGTMVLTATDPTDGLSVSTTFDLYINGTGTGGRQVVQAPNQPSTQTMQVTTPDVQSEWFTYDADNRVAVNNGALVNGQIVMTAGAYEEPSYVNEYDAAGNVAIQLTDVNGVAMSQNMYYDVRNELVQTNYATTVGGASLGVQQIQAYDADGHLLSTYQYLNNQASQSVYGTIDVPDGYVTFSTAGWVYAGETSTYNADGVVTAQVSLVNPATNWVQVVDKIQQGGTPPVGTDPSRLAVGSTTTYTAFDHADNVTAYSYAQNPPQGTTTGAFGANYTVNYIKKDGYLQQSTTGTPTVSGYVPATDTLYYNAFGQNIAVAQTSSGNSGAAQNITRAYAYNTAGEILEERSGTISGTTLTPTNGYFANHDTYVNGQQVSDMDEEGSIGVADTLTGFSSGTSTSGYVVQAGDTLASIAQAEYGNSQMGYIIGEANGLSATSTLVQGQSITIPAVMTETNTANTFKPYDPGSIVGSTTPNLPAAPPPPPPSSSGCSSLAEIVVIAVVIVASIYTAGAAAEAFSTTAAAAGTTSSTLAVGTAALGGSYGAAGIAAAAVGGFAGSVAGQLTGDALGVSSGFSLSQALTSGLAAGLTAGIGGELSEAGKDGASLLANSKGVLQPAGAALYGAGAYASGVAAAEVTGQAEHFSWAGLAASALASGVTAEAGLKGGPLQKIGYSTGSFSADVAGSLLSGGIDREASQLLGDDHVASWASIGEDAFGNALGNAAIAAYRNYSINDQVAKLPSDQQNAFHILVSEGTDPDSALQGAMAYGAATYRPLAAQNPTFSGFPQATALGGSYNYSNDQIAAYLQVLAEPNLPTGDFSEAQDVAGLVPIAGRVNALNATLATMDPSDPNYANLTAISQQMTYALASKDVYFNNSISQILPEGVTRLDSSQIANIPGISELATPGLLVDDSTTNNSGFFSAVYQNPNALDSAGNDSYIVADRGSQSLASWFNDGEQVMGMDAKQYDLAKGVADAINAQASDFGADSPEITFTGHSLGGGLASLQSYLTGDQAFTFNAAGLTQSTLDREGVTTEQYEQGPHLVNEVYDSSDIVDLLQDHTPAPSSEGMRSVIPSVNYDNLSDNSETPLSWYQKIDPSVWAQQHGMTYVIHALNYQLTQQLNGTSGVQ